MSVTLIGGLKQIFLDTYRRVHKQAKRRPSPQEQARPWIIQACERNLRTCYTIDVTCERVQDRFPRTKRKRTRKKWAKREANWHTFYRPHIGDGVLYLHEDQQPIQGVGYFNSSPTLEPWT